MRRTAKLLTLIALAAVGCGKTPLIKPGNPPAACYDGGKLDAVGQCVDCTADADCTTGNRCNLITGKCEVPPPPPVDAGGLPTCQIGAVRCGPGLTSVQSCVAVDGGGAWQDSQQCTGGRTCNPQTLTCAICIPGETICDRPDIAAGYLRCADDGTGFDAGTCLAAGDSYTCHQETAHQDATDGGSAVAALATCRMCQPNASVGVGPSGTPGATQDFHDGGVGILSCDSTGSSADFESCYPTFQFATYVDGGLVSPLQCKAALCYPGTHKCTGAANTGLGRETCNADGSAYVEDDCTNDTVCGPTASDRGACLSPCDIADNSTSYVGCDYWGTLMSNSQLGTNFTSENGGLSEYAFVIGNASSTSTATVSVESLGGSGYTTSIQVAPNSTGTVHLPWKQICGTGKATNGYHLTSNVPVTVYQFNPLTSALPDPSQGSCSGDEDCIFANDPYGEFCKNNQCNHGAFTDDASLLLPTHLLGESYVVVSTDHEADSSGSSTLPAGFSVVASSDDTRVSVHFAGAAVATGNNEGLPCSGSSGNLGAATAGQTVQYQLSRGDVLQFWTSTTGAKTCSSSGSDFCRYANDFTGTIVTSLPGNDGTAKKIAVFGGADCTFKPYGQTACDHIEEEMFPVSTWGKTYVGAKSHKYAGSGTYNDFWRIVSVCGTDACPNGTTVTISPAIASNSSRASANCSGGACTCTTNGSTTTCKLPAIASGQVAPWIEFEHASSFTALSDQPIQLAQYFVGEDQAGSSSEGDPSLVLAPPIEQWRSDYNVLAPTSYVHNYVNLMISSNSAPNGTVTVDGNAVSSGWSQISGTNYWVNQYALSNSGNGSHSILASGGAKVGAVVYGYDSYVSYGYTGGLDLQSIVGFKPPQ